MQLFVKKCKKTKVSHGYKINILALSIASLWANGQAQTVTTTGNTNLVNNGSVSPWSIGSSELNIAYTSGESGSVIIDRGFLDSSGSINIGQGVGSTGLLEVKNNGVVNANYLMVGRSGPANLQINSGGKVNISGIIHAGNIDVFQHSTNNINVIGEGSELRSSSMLYGEGDWESTNYLNILNGGKVVSQSLSNFQNGNLIVDGENSSLIISGEFSTAGKNLTGYDGRTGIAIDPTITVSNGARLETGSAKIGIKNHNYDWSSTTTLEVTGDGSQWVNSGDIYLGAGLHNNNIVINVEDGGYIKTKTITFGETINQSSSGDPLPNTSNTLQLLGNGSTKGTLATDQIINSSEASNNNIVFDGGVLASTNNNEEFISGFDNIKLGSNGITFDTQEFDIGISSSMSMDGEGAASTATLIKKGSGSLKLSGANNYNGGTFIENGLLVPLNSSTLGIGLVNIGGSGLSSAMVVADNINLANNVAVQSNGLLYGVGSVGSTVINSGGTIQAGMTSEDIGVMTINGTLDINGGTLKSVLSDDKSYQSDLIKVNGVANIAGDSSIYHSGVWDGYQLGEYFTVLEATTLNGTFSNLNGDYAFVDVKDDYRIPNTVRIGLFRNNVKFEDLALTPNQKSTAKALDQMNLGGLLDDYVATASKDYVTNSFDLLSGEIHATLRSGLLNWSQGTSQSSLHQLRSSMMTGNDHCHTDKNPENIQNNQGLLECNDRQSWTGWAQIVGNWNQISSDGNAAKSKTNSGGLLLGSDYGIGNSGWRVGGMFGYGKSTVKKDVRRSSADLQNYTLGAYAGKRLNLGGEEKLNLMGGISYTHHSIKTDRLLPRINQTLKSKYNGNTLQAFGEVGYIMAPLGRWDLEPFIGLNVSKQKVGSFEESGGFAGVHSKAESKTYTTAMLGLHAKSNLDVSGKTVQVRATAGLKQVLGNREITRTMAFNQGSPDYLIWGVPSSRSTALLNMQAHIKLSPSTRLEAGLSGEFGKKVREQAVQARLRWDF